MVGGGDYDVENLGIAFVEGTLRYAACRLPRVVL